MKKIIAAIVGISFVIFTLWSYYEILTFDSKLYYDCKVEDKMDSYEGKNRHHTFYLILSTEGRYFSIQVDRATWSKAVKGQYLTFELNKSDFDTNFASKLNLLQIYCGISIPLGFLIYIIVGFTFYRDPKVKSI